MQAEDNREGQGVPECGNFGFLFGHGHVEGNQGGKERRVSEFQHYQEPGGRF